MAVGGRLARGSEADDLPQGVRVSTEYPRLTQRYFAELGIEADVRLSYGATEAKVPDIVDCIVELTETGRALRAAGLKIIDTVLTSYTELIANPAAAADPAKRHAMGQIHTLLEGVLEARGKVLVKLNVQAGAARRGDRAAAGHEDADGQRALRRPGLRGRDGGAQVGHQRADPGAAGPGRHRHHRAADRQDRPLMRRRVRWASWPTAGDRSVADFDDPRGYGHGAWPTTAGALVLPLHRHRRRHPHHRGGRPVAFEVVAGHLGRFEAVDLRPA